MHDWRLSVFAYMTVNGPVTFAFMLAMRFQARRAYEAARVRFLTLKNHQRKTAQSSMSPRTNEHHRMLLKVLWAVQKREKAGDAQALTIQMVGPLFFSAGCLTISFNMFGYLRLGGLQYGAPVVRHLTFEIELKTNSRK